jgi:hypothetical protein
MTVQEDDFPGDAAAAAHLRAVRERDRERDVAVAESPPERPHLRDRLLTLDALADLPPVRPLVDGLIYRDTLAQLAGAPGSYKSFLSVGIASSVAAGVSFESHQVPEAGPVLYIAPEGASGIRVRVLAWCEKNEVDPSQVARNLRVLREPLLLKSPVEVDQAVAVAGESGVILTVLDTRARCTSGLEENSSTEQDIAIRAAERIQRASGGAVLGVHHTGRGGKHGRGSNAWDGAVWSDLQIEGADLRAKVHCEKHKDVPDGCDHPFRLLPHTVSIDLMPPLPGENEHDYLRRRSTLVAVQGSPLDTGPEESGNNATVLDIARTSAGVDGLSKAQLVSLAVDLKVSRSGAYAAVESLVRKGLLRNVGTDTRPKYVPTGQQAALGEEW